MDLPNLVKGGTHMMKKLIASIGGASLLTTALVSATPIVSAAAAELTAIVIVDVTTDTTGTCPSMAGTSTCSLRSAVEFANRQRNTPVENIVLGAGTYVLNTPLTIAGGYQITGARQPLGSPGATVIDAKQHQGLIIDADGVTIQGVGVVNAANPAGAGAIVVKRNRKKFLLDESSVDGSSGLEGGGLLVDTNASATVRRSTFSANTAKNKGGGIRVLGKLDIVNSTFTQNTAQSGGAISVAGVATASFSTFVDNTSNNSKGAGVDRNGGTVLITGSILASANQQSVDGSDCSGNPDLIGRNYVGNARGCNPDSSVLIGTEVGTLTLSELGDYTGPTRTIAIPADSAAVDAVPVAQCAQIGSNRTYGAAVTVDQRDVVRAQAETSGPGCDLGAYEVGGLSVDVELSSSTHTPFVGAEFLPADEIVKNVLGTDALFRGSLEASPLSAFPLEAAPLSAFPLSAFPLSAFPLSAFPLSAFTTAQSSLSEFPLSAFPLSAFPLSAFPLSDLVLTEKSWEELLKDSEFDGVPVQSLTLDDVDNVPLVATLSLSEFNLEGTPLSAFPLSAFLLNAVPLSAFPLSAFATGDFTPDDWCDLDFAADFCYPFEGPDEEVRIDPDDPTFTLASLALAGVPLSAFPLSAFPLNAFPLSAFPLNAFPLNAFPLSAFQLEASPLSAFPLSAFPLSAFDTGGLLVCGTGCDTTTGTLSDVSFRSGATLSDLAAAMLASCPLPMLGDLSTDSTGCAPDLGEFTLADLLAGLIPAGSVPWEQLDLGVPGLQNAADPAQTTFDYRVDLTLGERAESVSVELTLPSRFAYVPGSATLAGNPVGDPILACADLLSPDCLGGQIVATFTLSGVPPGTSRLVVGARAGFRVQEGALAEVDVVATSGTMSDEANDTHVVDVLAPPDRGVLAIASAGDGCEKIDGDVNLGWSTASTDGVDLYSFTVSQAAARCGLRADIYLSNLPTDFDLTLYGKLAPTLRGPNSTAIPYLDDVVLDLNPFDDVIQADVVQDIPQRLPDGITDSDGLVKPDDYGVVAVSTNRNQENERIHTGTLRPGTYYLQVSAYDGATSNDPYALRIRADGSVTPLECTALPAPTATPGVLPAVGDLPKGVNTLFLVNEQLLQYAYGADGRTAVLDELAQFDGVLATAVEFGVIGAIIPVDGNSAVRAAYAARFLDPCDPYASNEVVRAIGAVIDDYTSEHSSIANIVIVGDDRQIPMANIVDDANFANERTFAGEFTTANESTAALAAGMYRTDDPYGTDAGIRVRDHELFVPDRAVGRLVESPDEITATLDNFITFGGRLDPETTRDFRTAFQTGYEFLEDGAELNASSLKDGTYTVDRLFGETWTDKVLKTKLETTPYDVVGIHAHFDENNALPAYDNFNPPPDGVLDDELFDTSELPLAVDRAVVYSMGCHSGWNASDIQIGVDAPDWAQALTGDRTNVFVGNTGYGYGDTERVALTEQLTALFADEVTQDGAIGAAWVGAKQRMAGDILVLDAYQEKALQQFIFYGLPMFHVGDDPIDLRRQTSSQLTSTLAAEPSVSLATDPTGQSIWTVDITRALNDFELTEVTDPESAVPLGGYYSLDGRTLNVNGHPIQPLHAEDLPTVKDSVARDALITELSSVNLAGDFDPLFFQASPNFGGPRAEYFDGSFPAEMAAVRAPQLDGAPGQRALFAAGQYKASSTDPDVGIQRLHTNIEAEVYYVEEDSTDFTPPLMTQSEGLVDDGAALFRVSVDDISVGDVTERVYVLYRRETAIGWTGLDLEFDSVSGQWRGVGPITTDGDFMEYIVQAVDGSGNVGISNNKSQNFLGAPSSVANLTLSVVAPLQVPESGWYTEDITVEATNGDVADILYRLGAGPFVAYDDDSKITIDASGPAGSRLVTAIDTSGGFAALTPQVDAEKPTVAILTPVEWSQGPVEVEITAADGSGSGVTRIEYSVDGGVTYTTYDNDERPEVSNAGVTVRAIAYDIAGNASEIAERQPRIDKTAPTAILNLAGPDASQEIEYGTSVTVSPVCDDGEGSGIATCSLTVDGVAFAGTSPIVLPSDQPGPVPVVLTATDRVGLSTKDSATYTVVDRTAPMATVTVSGSPFGIGETPTATYSCDDEFSPITLCQLTVTDPSGRVLKTTSGAVTSFELPPDLPDLPYEAYTVTVTATDAAGNTSEASTTYQMVDDVAPVPTLIGLSLTQASVGDPVTAAFSCTDADSPIESCVLTVVGTDFSASALNGDETLVELPTDVSGVYTVVVTATDAYGNSASTTESYQYEVVNYLCVNEKYDYMQAKNIGSNYTIKIELCDPANNTANISSRKIVLEAYAITDAAGNTYDPGANDSGNANGGANVFRFRFSGGGYIYNLSTSGYTGPSGVLTLDFRATSDGTIIGIGRAKFTLSP